MRNLLQNQHDSLIEIGLSALSAGGGAAAPASERKEGRGV